MPETMPAGFESAGKGIGFEMDEGGTEGELS